MDQNTISYVCDSAGNTFLGSSSDVAAKLKYYLDSRNSEVKDEWWGVIYNFDITGTFVTATYEECSG